MKVWVKPIYREPFPSAEYDSLAGYEVRDEPFDGALPVEAVLRVEQKERQIRRAATAAARVLLAIAVTPEVIEPSYSVVDNDNDNQTVPEVKPDA